MAVTLEQRIDAMQRNKACTQGEPHDLTETTILIQAAQSQLAALASRLPCPANHIERNLHFNAITNCFGIIYDSITKLESIALAVSGYETTAPSASTFSSREGLDQFLMATAHRAKHWSFCEWDKCDVHMDGKERYYYPSGPHNIHVPRPLYSTSCFITPHNPKRRYEDRLAIPPPFTDDNGYPVFHTIINKENEHSSNHASQEDLPVPDAPVDYDDPFSDELSRALDIRTFQLS